MSFKKRLKKYFIKKSVDKKKRHSVFDINYADNYEMDDNAPNEFNNSHYFVCFNFENDEMFYFRLGKRGGDYDDEIWMVYRDKAGNVFVQENDHIKKGGELPARVEVVEAGKKLKFYFDGNVLPAIEKNNGFCGDVKAKPIHFTMEAEFKSTSDPFEFMQHLDSETLARALCEEETENLKKFSGIQQVHYEQAGKISAKFNIGGKDVSFSDYNAVRDHSYGPREWSMFDRYIWTIIVLENGDVYHTSLIRYPILRELKAGFVIRNGRTVSLLSSTSMDDLPIIGNVPKNFGMETKYTDGTVKNISCSLDFVVPYIFKGDFSVNEGFSSFTVNGVKGKGIAEFAFNADKTRWTRPHR